MVRLDYECEQGHRFERITKKALKRPKCPECSYPSDILWLSPESPHRQLQDPIVLWKYADGTLGVAGGVDSRTPRGAERIEVRSIGEYRRHAKLLNEQHRSKENRREERFLEQKERMEKERRSNLSWMMGQESDQAARDIYNAALESGSRERRMPTLQEYFSVAMEMDKSNYE